MIKILAIYALTVFGVYSMCLRFIYPHLTETELFLKIIGAN